MIVIWLSSVRKVVPALRVEFSTMKSAFFFLRFFSALASSSLVSRAKATMRWRLCFICPRAAAMSWVGARVSTRSSFSRLIFLSATTAGRKSATAAQRMAASQPVNSWVAASYISSQLSTSMRLMSLSHCSATGPAISVTWAPRFLHSSARANPILPDE